MCNVRAGPDPIGRTSQLQILYVSFTIIREAFSRLRIDKARHDIGLSACISCTCSRPLVQLFPRCSHLRLAVSAWR